MFWFLKREKSSIFFPKNLNKKKKKKTAILEKFNLKFSFPQT